MSFKCTERVWANSQHKGSELLVLLAIARHASDDGTDAWPSLAVLADETRLNERSIRYCIAALEGSGELVVDHKPGRGNSHQYKITLGKPENFATSDEVEPENFATSTESQTGKDCHFEVEKIATSNRKTLPLLNINMSIEPVHEPVLQTNKDCESAGAQENSPPQIEWAGVGVSGLRSFIASEAEKSPNIRQAIYDAACGVMDKNKLTADQSKQLTDFCDRYIGDTRLDAALVEYARGVCRDGDKRNLKYFYSIMSERLESDEWFGIDVERLIAEQEKQQKREEYRNGKQNGNSAIRGQRPFGNAKHQQNEASLREEMGYRANRRNGGDNHQVEIPR